MVPLRRRRNQGVDDGPWWFTAVGLIAIAVVAGCTAPGTVPDAEAPAAALEGQAPDGAFYLQGELFLRYPVSGRPVYLTAQWRTDDLEPGRHNYRVAELEILDPVPPDLPERLLSSAGLRLISSKQWDEWMARLLYELAPADESKAAVLNLQGQDTAVFRRGTSPRAMPLTDKPADVRIERTVGDDEFALLANGFVAAQLTSPEPVLVASGAGESAAYLLFDPARRLSVYVARPPQPPSVKAHPIGFALSSADALLINSHLITPLKSPVSTSYRLLWLTLHTGLTLIPKGAGRVAEAPPLASGPGMDLHAWEKQLDTLVQSKRQRGRLRLLIDGGAFFPRFIESVQDAKQSVWIRLYIFDRDDYAVMIADLLKARSREIDVRILLDHLGTVAAGQLPPEGPMPSDFEPPASIIGYLRQDSEVRVLKSPNPVMTSDHAKTILIDGSIAFLGGMNIGREYRFEWHDMMVEVEGPILNSLAADFERRWSHAQIGDLGLFLEALRQSMEATAEDHVSGYAELRPLYTQAGKYEILSAQIAAIRSARNHIYIQQPYLSDDEVLSALISARHRGVDVRVILPSRGDSGFMNSANLVTTNLLLRNGIRVFAFPGMTHVKAAIYDGWACFGSANMDKLSLRVNQELNLATSDPDIVGRLERDLFEVDFARSREITEARTLDWNVYLADFIAAQL